MGSSDFLCVYGLVIFCTAIGETVGPLLGGAIVSLVKAT